MQGILVGAEIQERVFEGQIEQTALPLLVFRYFAVKAEFAGARNNFRRGVDVGILFAQKLVTFDPLHFQRERADTGEAAAPDVDDRIEPAARKFLREMLFRRRIVHVPAREYILRIEHADVVDAVGNVIPEQYGIVAHAVRKTVIVQPDAAGNALFAHRHDGVQPRALEAGGEEQNEFEGGADLVFEDLGDVADGYGRIVTVFRGRLFHRLALDSRIDRRGEKTYLIFVPLLIAPPFSIGVPFFQLRAGVVEYAQAVRHLRADKGGEQFRVSAPAAPKIERQYYDADRSFGNNVFPVQNADEHRFLANIGKFRQIQRRSDIRSLDFDRTFIRNLLEMAGKRD